MEIIASRYAGLINDVSMQRYQEEHAEICHGRGLDVNAASDDSRRPTLDSGRLRMRIVEVPGNTSAFERLQVWPAFGHRQSIGWSISGLAVYLQLKLVFENPL